MPNVQRGPLWSGEPGYPCNLVGSARGATRRLLVGHNANGTGDLARWLGSLPTNEGIYIASAPTHFGGTASGEEDYAAQFARDERLEAEINGGLRRALATADVSGPAVEIGAGTGILTRPLLAATAYPCYFITDTSTEFLKRTRESLNGLGARRQVEYIVLGGEQVDLFPVGSLSLIALRYVLHHILEWERFIHASARALLPGGVLMFEEPIADGLVLQAALADALRHSPELASRKSASVRRELEIFARTTFFYASTDVDKSSAEDKHVFPAPRLLQVCQEAGLEPNLYPNQGFDAVLDPSKPGPDYFRVEFRHNLAVNFGFGADTLKMFDRHLAPVCEDLSVIDPRRAGPVVKAVVIARKPYPAAGMSRAARETLRTTKALASSRVANLRRSGAAWKARSRGERASGRAQSTRDAYSRPADREHDPPRNGPDGFSLTLDYRPSDALAPRWGHGKAPHAVLREVIAQHEDTYSVQLERASAFAQDLRAIERTSSDAREPSWINGFVPGLDGVALYALLRERKPRHYLEIGSGNSTKFVARAKRDGALDTTIVSIDPHPRAEVDGLCDAIIRRPLETAGAQVFDELESGDIVFFDGSHRTFTSSDSTVFFLEVLPKLPIGTIVGIHDVFLPDDYPPDWTDRYYSEQYLLAAYLLARCRWLEPILAAWYVSSHPYLRRRLDELWEDPRLEGVERHGCAFWMQVKDRASSE